MNLTALTALGVQGKTAGIFLLACIGPLWLCAQTPSDSAAAKYIFSNYYAAKTNYFAHVGNATSAWVFARACFDWADFATNDSQRAAIANEGISAARLAVDVAPNHPAGHMYLGLNLGQLARTKMLAALPMVREMERTFLRSIRLDANFDHATAHRSLGLLYLEVPGWPVSIGSKAKAREHLEKALTLAPEYPENHLALMEAFVRWRDTEALRAAMARYRMILPEAKQRFSIPERQHEWKEWEKRWGAIQEEYERLSR